MNIRTELLKEHSRHNAMTIAGFIANDPDKFAELMSLFLGNEYRVTQRAAQVVSYCADNHPQLITPFLRKILLNLRTDVHVAVKRNTLRILQHIELPGNLTGDAADICFRFLESHKEPVAVKAFAMTVLANICKKIPDLASELRVLIEDQLPYASAGFTSRGRKILQHLDDL